MKHTIELFSALSERLAHLPESIVKEAIAENPWYTPEAIHTAVEAIRREMLDPELLTRWLSAYRVPVANPKRVLVIMAGNLPLVGFFDLLCVVAAGHHCIVKPSSKDMVLTAHIINELSNIDPKVGISYYDGHTLPDAVIATGSDNTNRYFRARYGTIPTLLRGSRQSVAVLTGEESEAELRGLEEDIWLHNGLGCRNVSMLFLKEGMAFPAIRPTSLHSKYRNNYLQNKALLEMTSEPFIDLGGAVAMESNRFPARLSTLTYRYYRTTEEVAEWLTAHDRELQCVVAREKLHPRAVPFGRAQHPTLTDYPDAVDVVAFLEQITYICD